MVHARTLHVYVHIADSFPVYVKAQKHHKNNLVRLVFWFAMTYLI